MIKTGAISDPQGEYRQAFLRHLPKRIESIAQRIQFYRREGWEASGVALLDDDVQRLVDACDRYDLIEPRQHLRTIEQMLGEHMARKSLPASLQCERILALTTALAASMAARPDSAQRPVRSELAQAAPAAAATVEAPKVDPPATITVRHVYHLSDGNALASELGQRLRASDYEIETVETVDELSELLMCMSPQVLLVDVSRMSDLPAVGTARREAHQRSNHQQHIQMVAMAAQDDLRSRLDAHRAGVDVLLFPPFDAAEVLRRLEALLTPAVEETIRVLIVEDDRGQALFAQSVLTSAGMQAQVEDDPLHLLESLKSLNPDLVLMDLHMPDANGVELTALIREHPSFMRTMIVFLSGESDPEARFAAISAGGDDFLTKPIRPKHLIAAVTNRVRRMRSLERGESAPCARAPPPGL